MAYPPASATFLSACSAKTWSPLSGGCLVDGAGQAWFPSVGRDGSWTLTWAGDTIDRTTAAALHGATAQADGSFITTTGARYWLGDVSGAAVLDVWGPPPP